MARDFTKNIANHLSLGADQIGPLLNGASAISVASQVNPQSFNTGEGDNIVFQAILDGSTTSVFTLSARSSFGEAVVRLGGRSQASDSFQARIGNVQFAANSGYHTIGGVLDFPLGSIRLYLDGALGGDVGGGADVWIEHLHPWVSYWPRSYRRRNVRADKRSV